MGVGLGMSRSGGRLCCSGGFAGFAGGFGDGESLLEFGAFWCFRGLSVSFFLGKALTGIRTGFRGNAVVWL